MEWPSVGELLKHSRERLGWSQAEASRRTGIDSGTVCRIETGVIREPKFNDVARLAHAYGVEIETLARRALTD